MSTTASQQSSQQSSTHEDGTGTGTSTISSISPHQSTTTTGNTEIGSLQVTSLNAQNHPQLNLSYSGSFSDHDDEDEDDILLDFHLLATKIPLRRTVSDPVPNNRTATVGSLHGCPDLEMDMPMNTNTNVRSSLIGRTMTIQKNRTTEMRMCRHTNSHTNMQMNQECTSDSEDDLVSELPFGDYVATPPFAPLSSPPNTGLLILDDEDDDGSDHHHPPNVVSSMSTNYSTRPRSQSLSRPPLPPSPQVTHQKIITDAAAENRKKTKGQERFQNRFSSSPSSTSSHSTNSSTKLTYSLHKTYDLLRNRSLPVTSRDGVMMMPHRTEIVDLNNVSPSKSIATVPIFGEEEVTSLVRQVSLPDLEHLQPSMFRSPPYRQTGHTSDLQASITTHSPTEEETTSKALIRVSSGELSPDYFYGKQNAERRESATKSISTSPRRRRVLPLHHGNDGNAGNANGEPMFQRNNLHYVVYMSVFAMFGSIIRIYLDRLFGFDCEFPEEVNDFLTPLSKNICVTATGRTLQEGGALFVDLPANMVGSFLMGIMTTLSSEQHWPPLPWLRADHPLQSHHPLQVAITTGMCGSLTTFASWNTQMIVMLDGTNTKLGSQIFPALFGYLVGLYCAMASFYFGCHLSIWLNRWKNSDTIQNHHSVTPSSNQEGPLRAVNDLEEDGDRVNSNSKIPRISSCIGNMRPPLRSTVYPDVGVPCGNYRMCKQVGAILNGRSMPLILIAILMLLFVLADTVMDIQFYRHVWLSTLFAPAGALLRWKLARWNFQLFNHRYKWIPWGTVAANVIGCLVSVIMLGIETRIIFPTEGGDTSDKWVLALLQSVRLGFAGSLSTVSTFVKELADLQSEYPQYARAYYYAFGTISSCAVLSLCLYLPIVRG